MREDIEIKFGFIGIIVCVLIIMFFAIRDVNIKLILKPAFEKYGCSCQCETNHE